MYFAGLETVVSLLGIASTLMGILVTVVSIVITVVVCTHQKIKNELIVCGNQLGNYQD